VAPEGKLRPRYVERAPHRVPEAAQEAEQVSLF
jgi:hypothetical protein